MVGGKEKEVGCITYSVFSHSRQLKISVDSGQSQVSG